MASNKVISYVVQALAKEGERILKECESERTYTHRTKNLYDSYGYGIYVGGKLSKIGFLTSSPSATTSKRWYGKNVQGREQIESFLRGEYTPTDGIDLVIAAAMPYAEVLENGTGGALQKYKVISMAYNKLAALQAQLPNSSVANIFRSKRQ